MKKWSFNEWQAAWLIPLLTGVLISYKWLDYPEQIMGGFISLLTMIVVFFYRKAPPTDGGDK